MVIIWLPCEPHQRSKCNAYAKFITCRDLVTVENTRKGLAQYSQPFLMALLQKICDSSVQGLTTRPPSSSSGRCNCLARPERRAWPQSCCLLLCAQGCGKRGHSIALVPQGEVMLPPWSTETRGFVLQPTSFLDLLLCRQNISCPLLKAVL